MTHARQVLIADRLSPSMRHVVLRCSEAEYWCTGQGVGRTWYDLVYGRRHCSMSTVKALIARDLIYQRDDLFGLTDLGLSVQLELRMRARKGGR